LDNIIRQIPKSLAQIKKETNIDTLTVVTFDFMKMVLISFVLYCFLSAILHGNVILAASPTASPTMQLNPLGMYLPEEISDLDVKFPIAEHQLVVVEPGGNSLIQLSFYDAISTNV
jgi:hypothetical protein